jgi:hypothetical protein
MIRILVVAQRTKTPVNIRARKLRLMHITTICPLCFFFTAIELFASTSYTTPPCHIHPRQHAKTTSHRDLLPLPPLTPPPVPYATTPGQPTHRPSSARTATMYSTARASSRGSTKRILVARIHVQIVARFASQTWSTENWKAFSRICHLFMRL